MYTFKKTGGGRYVVSIDNHVEIAEALTVFCRAQGIRSGASAASAQSGI